jgi:class 3 adenylate cyclase/tetratricopeptide (TPR) repeat protein
VEAARMKCLNCGEVNSIPQRFCGECGARLEAAKATESTSPTFTQRSYTPPHLAEKILQTPSALEGERRHVTVLFCDISNSTPLAERIGPERMHKVLNAFFVAALAEVHRYEGTVNQFLGDGFMALFGAPIAHEDHARRAMLAALDIQRVLAEGAPKFLGGEGALGLRIGLNSGAVVVGKIGDNLRMDYTAVGDTTNVAARLQAIAEPGTILASDGVYRATSRWIDFESLGKKSLKGKAAPVSVYRAVGGHSEWRDTAGFNALSREPPLVGREAELAAIKACVERLAEGGGAILAITGDAGLGKTRLAAEASRMARERGLACMEGSCLSFGQAISYWPFREAIRRHFGIAEDDQEDVAWARLRMGIELLVPDDAEELLPYIGTLLALRLPEELTDRTRYLDGMSMGQQIFRSCLRLITAIAQQGPLMLLFEDWQWSDESSMELLSHLITLVSRAPTLFVILTRKTPDRPAQALQRVIDADPALGTRQTQITLIPLASEDSVRLAETLLEGGTLPAPVLQLLLDRAAGNPFFTGEIVRALIATGALVRDKRTGEWEATARLDSAPLPETIEGVIFERIDRIEEEAKQVLKAAAVVGRSFIFRVLQQVTDASTALDDDLSMLQKSEFIRERQHAPEREYMFQHPLIQQATYNSLLEDRKRLLHRRVGEIVETLFAGRIEEFYPVLAHHFARAEDWDKARHYLFKAGDQAGSIAADAEALEHYREAIAASEKVGAKFDPIEHAVLDRKIGEALFRLGQHELSLTYLTSALLRLGIDFPKTARARGIAIVSLLARLALGRLLRILRLKRDASEPPSPELLEGAQTLEVVSMIEFYRDQQRFVLGLLYGLLEVDRHPQLPAYTTVVSAFGLVLDFLGFYRTAQRFHDRAREVTEQRGDLYRTHYSGLLRGVHEYVSGDWVKADATLDAAAHGLRELGHLRLWAMATSDLLTLRASCGDSRWLDIPAEQLQVAIETGDNQMLAWATLHVGCARLFLGDSKDAANQLRRACELLEAIPDYQLLPSALSQLAFALVQLGRPQEALPLLLRSGEICKRHSVRGFIATRPLLATAETCLVALERGDLPAVVRANFLELARKACREALVHSRRIRDHSEPDAQRLHGMLKWLRGNEAGAKRAWLRSCEVAERLGAQQVLAQTHYEMGRRLGIRDHLETAERRFLASGALADLMKTRRALADLRLTSAAPRI